MQAEAVPDSPENGTDSGQGSPTAGGRPLPAGTAGGATCMSSCIAIGRCVQSASRCSSLVTTGSSRLLPTAPRLLHSRQRGDSGSASQRRSKILLLCLVSCFFLLAYSVSVGANLGANMSGTCDCVAVRPSHGSFAVFAG